MRAILWTAVSSGKQAEEDKESLPEQKLRLDEIAAQQGWSIIDLIVVPGHSRVYYNYLEFATAAVNEGIPGPMRMFKHWERKDFDVFACLDGSRFGREQSIFAEVVARTIDIGAQLFTLKDGYIHQGNRRMFVSMAGYSAASEIDELVRRRKMGMKGRAERGVKTSSHTLFGYREIRDALGKTIRQEPDPELQYIFDRLAQEMIKGTPWLSLSAELHRLYGIVNPRTGKVFDHNFFFKVLGSPTFWGHSAMNLDRKFALWAIDEDRPIPEGVIVYRNTHAPVYSGVLAEAVKKEILRRAEIIVGQTRPKTTHRFSGLVVCGECGSYLSITGKKHNKVYENMRCQRHYSRDPVIASECGQVYSVNSVKIKAYIDEYLQRLMASENPELLLSQGVDEAADVERLQKLIKQAEDEMNNVAYGMRSVSPSNPAFDALARQAEQIGTGIQRYRQELEAKLDKLHAREQHTIRRSLDEIAAMTLASFWELPARRINQYLHIIFSGYKVVGLNGQVTGLATYSGRPPRQHTK